MKQHYDAIIIGGGASGLMCAIAAKRKNPRMSVAIIEKNDRVGKKLLSTGNGRCNLTNANVAPDKYVGNGAKKLVGAVLQKYNVQSLLDYFGTLGLLTSKDSEGRYYPLSRQASTVLDVLRFNCEALGIEMICGEAVTKVAAEKGFSVATKQNIYTAKKLVIAAGSPAAPKLGGSRSEALFLGHKAAPFSAALCPVTVRSDILKSLKGLRVQAEVKLESDKGVVKAERGEVQFNEDNLSGICVFDLSLFAKPDMRISLDLLPDISEKELYNILIKNKELFANHTIDNLLTGILQKRMAQAVLKSAGVKDFSRSCSTLGDGELGSIAKTAKSLCFTVTGNAGFDRAQACRGGVLCGQIDPVTMQSLLVKNLYFCGEALDVCGECGGYNLHFAFAGGIIAGESL
ncbi:MAG: aminoacetone oxidase family FAD-binding enzyme [Ruminococcus sp.]|nr:aminoacetone oxidase family FAD-binding enzyme [Ruminococcus sp.]